MIYNTIKYINSFIFSNDTQETRTQNTITNSQAPNNNYIKSNATTSANTDSIVNRQIVANNNLQNQINFENSSIFLTEDDLEINRNSITTNNNSIDLEDYELIYHDQVKDGTLTNNKYNYLPIRYINNICFKVYNNFYVDSFSNFIKDNYNFVFGDNYCLHEINLLIDSLIYDKHIDNYTLKKLSKLNQDYFYHLLISQIIAKMPNNTDNNFGFIHTVASLYTNIKNKYNAINYNSKDVKALTSLLILSLNHAIKEVANIIITEQSLNQLTKYLEDAYLEYSIDETSYENIKDQFIKDVVRLPKTNISLQLEDKIFWSDSTEEIQSLNWLISNEHNNAEKYLQGEKLFIIYEKKLTEFLANINSDYKEELINILLTEITQAGVALHSRVMIAIQSKICKDILQLPNNYDYASITTYERTNTIKIKDNQLIMTIALIIHPGLFIQGPIGDEIISKNPVNITIDLLLDSNDIKNSKYKNIRVSLIKD